MKLLICTQAIDKNHPILGFFHAWVEEFSKHFEEVHVICLVKGEYSLPEHVHVYSLGKEEGENKIKYLFRFYKYFSKFFFKVHVDFVFFHMGAIYNILGAPFFFLRKIYKTKFYWWKTHGHIDLAGRVALLFVDTVYTGSKESFPVKTKKVRVVGSAVDIGLFTSSEEKRDITILFVGRISPIKNVDQVIKITKCLKDLGINVKTRIVGNTPDKAYAESLYKLCDTLELNSEIAFVGARTQEQLVGEYQRALISVNPSDTDSFDKVAIEAMACESILLSSNETFRSMLEPYGLYVEKGKIDSYVEKICSILDMSLEQQQHLTSTLHSFVREHFSLTTLPERIFYFKSF